jgi:putative hemolysin
LLAGSSAPRFVVAVALLAVPLVLFAAYLVPRWLTQPRAETVAEKVIPMLRPWSRVLGVLLPARMATRPTDLRSIWREGAAVGLEDDGELAMVGGVMAFSARPVREVMTPRTDIVAIEENAPLAEIRLVFAGSGYSRIPVFRGTLDDIIGMLHAFDLFKLEPGDPLPVRPVAVTPASRSCGDLLLDMQRERRHLAVVLDEFGGTLGIATLEDLLEELVGEIFDEHDEEVRPTPATAATLFETDVSGGDRGAIWSLFSVQPVDHGWWPAGRADRTDSQRGRAVCPPGTRIRHRAGLTHPHRAPVDPRGPDSRDHPHSQ